MEVLFAAHKGVEGLGPLYTPWDEVLERSDVITLHAPLMPATRNMIARPEFEKMKRRPLLINCARGGLVDEKDLVWALETGRIAGAGFDCLTSEPPVADNPLLAVLRRPNVIVTPHTAWASNEAMQTLWDQTVSHLENFHAGKPSNRLA
jgi:glycerate dehydrogenase